MNVLRNKRWLLLLASLLAVLLAGCSGGFWADDENDGDQDAGGGVEVDEDADDDDNDSPAPAVWVIAAGLVGAAAMRRRM